MSAWKPFKKFQVGDLLPADLKNKLRKLFLFSEQTGAKQANQSPDASQSFRTPAPTSQPNASVPILEKSEAYNIQYYTRDVIRNQKPPEVSYNKIASLLGSNHDAEHVKLAAELKPQEMGSPGNKNPAVLQYDPSGTRSAMSTTPAAVSEILQKHEATQTVRYEWEPFIDSILKDCERKGIPPVPGRPYPWAINPKSRERVW